ncbi:MAG: discoidin domain-containing protein [Sedimentisphaerales bacterium]|nr:discoidin domain-containing protein [Sedimentisphaerales bacterium]
MYKKIIILAIPVCMLCFCSLAGAQLFDPPVENPSFEATDLGPGGTGQWVDYAENWIINYQGNCYLEDGSWEIVAPDGIATLKMWSGAAIWQQIGTWNRNTDYEISLWVGRGHNSSAFQVELWAGGNPELVPASGFGTIENTVGATLIVGAPLTPTVSTGESELMTLILNTGTVFNAGDALWLRIESLAVANEATWLDNVTVASVRDPVMAYNPNPLNSATEVPRDVVLSWTPGMFARSHDIYFGTNPDDVINASRTEPSDILIFESWDANNYDIGRLEFGQTYYWRIDEVNDPSDSYIYTGDLWSFTVESLAYPIPSEMISATASSQSEGQGPENTINNSGLDADDLHSTELTTMWLSQEGGPGTAWIQYEFTKPYKLNQILVWNYNGQTINALYGFNEVIVEYSTDGDNWTRLENASSFTQATGAEGYASNTTVDFKDVAAKYVKITASNNFDLNWGLFRQYGLSEVRFMYIPVNAKNPSPADGATNVAVDSSLSWKAGRDAAQHNLLLNTDQQVVVDGTAAAIPVNQTSYSPDLNLGSTYYWRIDEVNNAETPPTWIGSIWSFSTQDYHVVDDFESYNDIPLGEEGSNLVYLTWVDGYENPSVNGSTMGYTSGSALETNITIEGSGHSVPLFYDNTSASLSEIVANTNNLPIGRDWSKGSPQTLVMLIYGDPANAATDRLYVKIGNIKKTFDGNLSIPIWKQWNIDLTGMNLSNVTTMTIGIESSGSGMIFLDDISLYRTAPPVVQPEDPGTGNLMALYSMENNVQDSSGNNLNGTAFGSPIYQQGLPGYGMALSLDGDDDYIELTIGQTMNAMTDCTITTWVNWADEERGTYQRIFDFGSSTTVNMFLTPSTGSGMRFAITTSGSGAESRLNSSSPLSNEWRHVAVVIDSTAMSMELYLDGQSVASGSTRVIPSDLGQTTNNWLGRSQYTADDYFAGSLDDFRIYNAALSAGQIRYIAGDR